MHNILLPDVSTMKSTFGGEWWEWDFNSLQSTIVNASILEIQTGSEPLQARAPCSGRSQDPEVHLAQGQLPLC